MKLTLTKTKKCLFATAAAGLIALTAWPAAATLMVTPMIVVIEGRARYADVNLINTSNGTEGYAIGWKFLKMTEETGDYQEVDASITPFDLTKNIVFTPRRVTVEANGMQKIRLGLRLKGEPPAPGDYRAHLEMAQEEKPQPITTAEAPKKDEVRVGVAVRVGFSVPIIYRVGESDAVATIGNITKQFNQQMKKNELVIPIARSGGPFGFYGQLLIKKGNTVVGEVRNANIFPEVSQRVFKVALNEDVSPGSVRVVFKHYDVKNETVFAEKSY